MIVEIIIPGTKMAPPWDLPYSTTSLNVELTVNILELDPGERLRAQWALVLKKDFHGVLRHFNFAILTTRKTE